METVEQFPFVLCACPSFADQPYITNYRIYDDPRRRDHPLHHRPDHEWYWFPRQTPTESRAEVLRLRTTARLALVLPHRLRRPDRARDARAARMSWFGLCLF